MTTPTRAMVEALTLPEANHVTIVPQPPDENGLVAVAARYYTAALKAPTDGR